MKTKVAVLFGGRSVEHEVSIISGIQAFCALDREKYDPIPLYIGKDNAFYTGPHMGDIESYKNLPACIAKATRVLLLTEQRRGGSGAFPDEKIREQSGGHLPGGAAGGARHQR